LLLLINSAAHSTPRHHILTCITPMSSIYIQLHGKPHELAEKSSIQDLLQQLGFGSKPVVVELNQIALFPRDYNTTTLKDSDSVELITISAGG